MVGDAEQRKKMVIGVVAVVAILGAGVGLAYYYDLLPGSGSASATGAPSIETLPPQMQEEAKKVEEVRQAEFKKKKPAGS